MSEFKKQVREFLLAKGLTEQQTSRGICYIYRFCKGEWQGDDWAEVMFPNNYYSNRIEVATGYSGACSGDEGYDIASYKGSPKTFEEFLAILELTRFNSQVEKGENQYKFSQAVANYKG